MINHVKSVILIQHPYTKKAIHMDLQTRIHHSLVLVIIHMTFFYVFVVVCNGIHSTENGCNNCSSTYYAPRGRAMFWDNTPPSSCEGEHLMNT